MQECKNIYILQIQSSTINPLMYYTKIQNSLVGTLGEHFFVNSILLCDFNTSSKKYNTSQMDFSNKSVHVS